MTTTYLDTLDSTQKHLKKLLQSKSIPLPHAIVCDTQTNGVGSRNNVWHGLKGNLFLSFAIELKYLPSDLKLESSSIYFSYLLKEVLHSEGSMVWLKWPNDFYVDKVKVGGMITNVVGNALVCGVGINLFQSPSEFTTLDVVISRKVLLDKYFKLIDKRVSWKQVFSKYKIEFERNREFFTHNNSLKLSLDNAILESDGSVTINKQRIYSTR